jgi:hypothetical protein
MKRVNFNFSKNVSRRTFLKGAGVSMALPWLDSMLPAFAASSAATQPRRFVSISLALGLHGPNLNPIDSGFDYTPSVYLSKIKDLKNDMTIVTGASHPDVSGGHKAEGSILTAAPYSSNGVFRNSISLDQYMAKHLGHHTRYPSLVLNLDSNNSPSYTENGSMIPAEHSVSKLFDMLFITDSPEEIKRQRGRLRQGRSIMDVVSEDARRLQRDVGKADREKLDQYFTSVRNFEHRLSEAEDWVGKPKPKVDMAKLIEIADNNAVIRKKRLLLDIMYLAIQTDSTRFMTLHLNGNGGAIPIEGVEEGYHSLSHHGLDENKIGQLTLVETELVKAWGGFVRKLKETPSGDGTLLDQSMVLMTSNLGNASAHDNKNMPVLFAGGGFKHGQHIAFDQKNNYPLPNLYLSAAQRLGLEKNKFASSSGTLAGLEMV